MAFSAITARGSNTSNTNGTTLTVSPTADLTVGKIIFVSCTSDNNQTTSGTSTSHTVTDDTGGNTWNKVFEVTETDGAVDDGSTTSLWWCRVTTQINTTNNITLTLGSSHSDKIISIVEATVGTGKEVAFETNYTSSTFGVDGMATFLVGLTEREYLLFGLFGAEGEDTSKTPDTDYTEQYDLVSTTAGAAASNVQQHVQTRVATVTTDSLWSTEISYTSGIQSLTAFYEVDIPVLGSNIKVWNGASWVEKPLKVWNGSTWENKILKYWNGSSWITI